MVYDESKKMIEAVNKGVSISAVIERYTGQTVPDGKDVSIHCPLPSHGGEDKNPSFRIYEGTNTAFCFAENIAVDPVGFVAAYTGKTQFEAAKTLDDEFKIGVFTTRTGHKLYSDLVHKEQKRIEDYKAKCEKLIIELEGVRNATPDDDPRHIIADAFTKDPTISADNPAQSLHKLELALRMCGGDPLKVYNGTSDDLPDAVDLDTIPDVDMTPFLWYPYIPMQEVTILAAPGGTGKGMLFTLLAARLSTGTGFNDVEFERCPERQRAIQDGERATTLILSKEDGAVRILPRFLVSTGDKQYLKIVDDTLYDGNNKEFLLRLNVGTDEGCAELERWIRKFDPKLVILDPVTSFMPGKRLNNGDDTRTVLSNLTRIARVTNTAILAVTHTRKGSKDDVAMTDLIAGSHEIKDVARSVLMIGYDIEDDRTIDDFDYRTPRRLMYHVKSNHAELGKTVRYYIHTKGKQGGGRFPTSESGFSSFSDVTAEVLERTPHGMLPALYWKRLKGEREARKNTRDTLPPKLWAALTAIINDMHEQGRDEFTISYKTFDALNGGGIWSGERKQGEDLTKCAAALAAQGVAVIPNQKTERNTERGFTLKIINE